MIGRFTGKAVDLYEKLNDFVRDHAAFSDRVFGTVDQRGPVGPLKHMEKECKEAYEQWERLKNVRDELVGYEVSNAYYDPVKMLNAISNMEEAYNKELADLFLLLMDAMRRSKMKFGTLLDHAIAKLRENEKREWPPFDPTKVDEAIEHVRK